MLLHGHTTNRPEEHMTRSKLAALTATVAVTATVTGISAAAAASSPTATTHTMRFESSQLQDVMSNDRDVATDKNIQNGKTVGYDVTTCNINITTHVATCVIALARAGGLMYGRAKINLDTGKGTGTVTGGTGSFHGATGTMTASPGSSQNTTTVTIKYQV
jgi:hypothetical protein